MVVIDWARVILGAFFFIESELKEENLVSTPLKAVLPQISFENALKMSLKNEYRVANYTNYNEEISMLSELLKDCIREEISNSPNMTFRDLNQAQVLLCVYNNVEEKGLLDKMYFGLFVG